MKKLVIAMAAVTLLAGISFAQAPAPIMGVLEGRLQTVYSDFLTVAVAPQEAKSPDVNQAQSGEVSIKLEANTRYDNVGSISDLKQGDAIKVEYQEVEGNKIAAVITKLDKLAVEPVIVPVEAVTTTTTVTTTTP